MKTGVQESMLAYGINTKWFIDFKFYWSFVLGGRPIWSTLDFFLLVHDYRKAIQSSQVLNWDSADQHLSNWQSPSYLYHTLHYVRKLALRPIINPSFWRFLGKGSRVLEYGCSLAPYYSCYNNYFSHLRCHWTLADIPNFPFHYCKYLNYKYSNVFFLTIFQSMFQSPLQSLDSFDVIIVNEVFEHLDNPLDLVKHMFSKLKPGGIFVFDFILSDGTELDHPVALEQRLDTLKFIASNSKVLVGDLSDFDSNVGMHIVRKY
jgi:SAM-dependent methyltransferase